MDEFTIFLGWASVVVLVATITAQITRQWRQATSQGVSPWLYIGQFVASLGFLGYSLLERQWVFVVLNIVMATAAILGFAIWRKFNGSTGHAATWTASS